MSYFLASENGYVCDVATATGWDDLVKAVESIVGKGALVDLFESGTTEQPSEVVKEIDFILPKLTNRFVRDTLKGLQDGLKRCQEIGIISQ